MLDEMIEYWLEHYKVEENEIEQNILDIPSEVMLGIMRNRNV
jgi:hypothetical protein